MFTSSPSNICLYTFILSLFPSRTFANGSFVENKTSTAIMFKRLAARFVAAKNRVWGFVRILTSTFSLVMISLSSDIIAFWFSVAIAIVSGTVRRNLAERYARVFNKFDQLKTSSCYTGMVSYRKKIKISHVLNFRNIY